MLLLSIVYITYLHNSTTHTSIIYALFNPGIEFIPLLGLLSPTEIDGDRVLMLVRVSSASQGSNTSKSSQKAALNDAVKEIDGTVIEVLEAEESAADIERNQLTRTLEMAQEDLYDILMVYEVDRLSRADPWDTLRYLHDLQQSNITLYCDSHGFIDWAQYYDFEILTREAVFARRWLDRLRKGRVDGCEQKLRNGKWPFGGNPPVGYCTDDKNNLKLDQRYAKYVPDIFEIYLRTENRSETLRQINSKFEQENIEKTTYQRIKTVLQSKLVLGRLEYDGKLVTTNSQLQLVDKELFQDAQALQSKQGGRPESNSMNYIKHSLSAAHTVLRPRNSKVKSCGLPDQNLIMSISVRTVRTLLDLTWHQIKSKGCWSIQNYNSQLHVKLNSQNRDTNQLTMLSKRYLII
ncbi:recombinase family protein [Halorubraceae archaeon YAN]|nr:recombinase family protein [Halorubraceae archaeon YAN]